MAGKSQQRGSQQPPITEAEAKVFKRSMAYMRKNFTATLVEVAADAGISPFHFHRRFSLWAGKTPKQLMTEFQLECAQVMLLKGEPLAGVSDACGFAHQSHFTARFSMFIGTSPGRWIRARHREAMGLDSPKAAA